VNTDERNERVTRERDQACYELAVLRETVLKYDRMYGLKPGLGSHLRNLASGSKQHRLTEADAAPRGED